MWVCAFTQICISICKSAVVTDIRARVRLYTYILFDCMPQKKVMIVMDDKLHKIIKSLSNVYDVSISELITLLVTPGIHRFGLRCSLAAEIFSQFDVRLDYRVNKWCWGFNCVDCKYLKECQQSLYDGSYISVDNSKCLPVAGDRSYGVPDYVHHDYFSIE